MPSRLSPPLSPSDHVRASGRPRVMIVEYGDFECPFSARGFAILEQLRARFGEAVGYAFRHFPLTQKHPHALGAALAAEAAGRQGRFWEMHDVLFNAQGALEPEDIARYAGELGLDLSQFADDLEDPALEDHVRDDFESGLASGVQGTPTFFIDGEPYEGDTILEPIAERVASALGEQEAAR